MTPTRERKTAHIDRKPGESVRVQIDDVTVVFLRVKGKLLLDIEYPEGVKVWREDGKKEEEA